MEAGADAMVTPCPLCHLSLDAWQQKLEATTGRQFQMPILHLSQLIGVAAGLEASELKFKRHVVPVTPVLEKLEAGGLGETWSVPSETRCSPRGGGLSRLRIELIRRLPAFLPRNGIALRRRATLHRALLIPAALLGLVGAGAAAAAWGWFEAGWVRLEVAPVRSVDFRRSSTGCGSRTSPISTWGRRPAGRAVERAVDWVEARKPDDADLGRPALAAERRGEAARAGRTSAECLRGAREPRLRGHEGSVLAAGRAG